MNFGSSCTKNVESSGKLFAAEIKLYLASCTSSFGSRVQVSARLFKALTSKLRLNGLHVLLESSCKLIQSNL